MLRRVRSLIGGIGGVRAAAPVPLTSTRAGSISVTSGSGTGSMSAQLAAMGSMSTLFAIADRIATAVSETTWHLYYKRRPGETADTPRREVTSHAVIDLWNNPNPFMARNTFVETFQQHLELAGETEWLVSYADGLRLPLELWPIRPDRMTPVTHPTEFMTGWTYQSPDGDKIPLDLDEVIQIKRPNPVDAYRGMGPVQTLLADIDSAKYSAQWNRNFFRNSAEPGGVIEVDHEMDDREWKQFTTRWRAQHQGVAQAHRIAVIENGMKWVDRKFTQRDMQFSELARLPREFIREGFGISKTMLGLSEDVNRATAGTAEYIFARWLIKHRLDRIKGVLNVRLLPLYGRTAEGMEWDYDSPVPDDEEAENSARDSKVTAWGELVDRGVDPTEAARIVGLPDMTISQPQASASQPQAGASQGGARDLSIPEALQKVYLAVGTVVTSDEARTIINGYGADLTVPGPDFTPPPQAPPFSARLDQQAIDRILAAVAANHAPAVHLPVAAAVPDLPEPPEGIPARLPAEAFADLTDVQESWQAALDQLLGDLSDLTAAQRRHLVDQIGDLVAAGDVSGLAGVLVDATGVTPVIEEALIDLARKAARQAADEAADQDIEVAPGHVDSHRLSTIAVVASSTLAAGLAMSAIREALRVWAPRSTPTDVTTAVEQHLDDLTDAQPRLVLGGVLTSAQHDGRLATMLTGPTTALYASEILDTNTCGPCAAVNRRWLGNSDDPAQPWLATYPAGGYIACKGRERCRGQIVAVWRGGTDWTKWIEKQPWSPEEPTP
jgi:HK97 family phage portal protein